MHMPYTMQRIPEPELMNDPAQARAYAQADFTEPHDRFVALFREKFPQLVLEGTVLDLGCGPADVTCRFARAWPACRIHGIDGAPNMLQLGREAIARQGLVQRVNLIDVCLPGQAPPFMHYDALISNSLLHRLADPLVLWRSVVQYVRPGAPVFIMDLLRPDSQELARAMVQNYAAVEPAVLQTDFYNSLCAAFTPEEVMTQLAATGLTQLQIEVVSDRHLIVYGYR